MSPSRIVRAIALVTAILAASACSTGAGSSPTSLTAATPTVPPTVAPTDHPADTTGTPIHLVKDCSTFNGEIPSYCTISSSDYPAVPIGAKVMYLGPLLNNPRFLSSNVLIDDARGNTATGYCIFDGRPSEARGVCTFWEGTGALARFIAIMKVTIDATGVWHLDGEHYGPLPSPGPS